MAVAWTIYAHTVLSCCFYLPGDCSYNGYPAAPYGFRYMMMNDINQKFDPNSYTIMNFGEFLMSGKQQQGAATQGKRNAGKKTSARGLPEPMDFDELPNLMDTEKSADGPGVAVAAEEGGGPPAAGVSQIVLSVLNNKQQKNRHATVMKGRRSKPHATPAAGTTADDDHGRKRRAFFARDYPPPPELPVLRRRQSDGGGDDSRVHRDGSDTVVWREDAVVAAVVVDPGRRVRMFVRADGDDGTVAAVDARAVDDGTAADDPSAVTDGALAIAALYLPVVDQLARRIVPGIRSHQVHSLALNAARVTWDAIEYLAVSTRDSDDWRSAETPTALMPSVPSKPVNGLGNYVNNSIYNLWKNIFPYYYQSLINSNPNADDSSSPEKQIDYEGEMYNDDNFKDSNGVSLDELEFSEYVKYDDDNVDHGNRDDDDVDEYNAIRFKVDNSYDDNSKVSRLDKTVQYNQLLEEMSNIQFNFIKAISEKQLLEYVDSLNVKQQESMFENQKVFEWLMDTMMNFNENISDEDVQQLITTVTSATNLFIASILDA